MAPRRTKNFHGDLANIARNWHIQPFEKCLPKTLWPNKHPPDKWDDEFIALLSQISSVPTATLPDFRRRLKKAIQIRQEKNSSAIGRQPWAKGVDLKTVLEEYRRDAETKVEEVHPTPRSKEKLGNRTTRNTRLQIPKTPINQEDEDEDEEEEEGSSEPLAGGKYQYLNGVRPVKVNLNPEASAAKKPTRPKPPPRGKRRKADEPELPEPLAAGLPSRVYQDPDPRVPDDTGFLSDLEGDGTAVKGRKKKKRLSRLQQHRVREPHWQLDLDNIVVDVPSLENDIDTPTVRKEVEITPIISGEDVAMEDVEYMHIPNAEELHIHKGQDVIMNNEEDVEMELENLPEIPENATVTERREMEELRLKMEQRVWRIKVLRIKEREGGGGEVAEQDDDNGNVENYVGSKSKVLRKRREK
ncbi:hypothetical protein G6011_05040 [Alternaria panax]|uniref:Uncharacterized protein n=1 Tax=Alternaria panax TaxID=48097 RepID=A0AAD4I8T2_9PLEO|nr:hypothetical protein G6011_05040 [Alternaria panax]